MLPENLRTEQYYINKLSLFMQNDEKIRLTVRAYFEMLKNIDDVEVAFHDEFMKLMNEFTDEEVLQDANTSIVDIIASLFDLSRTMKLVYKEKYAEYKTYYETIIDRTISEEIDLINDENGNRNLKLLIYLKIAANSFDGTRESLDKINSVLDSTISAKLAYQTTDDGTCRLYMFAQAENILAYQLFFAELLHVKSLGVSYDIKLPGLDLIGEYAESNDDAPSVQTIDDVVQIWCDDEVTYYANSDGEVQTTKTETYDREVGATWL